MRRFFKINRPIFFIIMLNIFFNPNSLADLNGKISDLNAELSDQVAPMVEFRSRFDLGKVSAPCKEELRSNCSTTGSAYNSMECLKRIREHASQSCETALLGVLGGKPFIHDTLHKGVLLPKGSYFFYDPTSSGTRVNGVIVPTNFYHNGIEYAAGQVGFTSEDIGHATLARDQIVDGMMLKANSVGPFFDEQGHVKNAVLSADTEIDGFLYQSDTQIKLYDLGRVMRGNLAMDTFIEGEMYSAGSMVMFNEDGTLKKVISP